MAEELVFGDISTGAQDDLQRATNLARDMITRYGMSEALGLTMYDPPRQALFLDVPAASAREYSEETARGIDGEIRALLAAAHDRVRGTLSERRTALDAVASVLLEREVVEREQLTRLLGESTPAAA